MIVSALAVGKSKLQGVLDSEDTRVMVESLRRLGFVLEQNTAERTIEVQGRGGKIPVPSADLYVENSGTSLRFLTALVALGHGQYRLDGNARMRERPVADLLSGLNSLGAIARSEADNGCPPVVVDAHGLDGGYAFVKGNVSSQYLSALLMVLPLARDITSVEVEGVLVSKPYIDMTLQVMEWFGLRISNRKDRRYTVNPGSYRGRTYPIEPDASAASYFYALAAITGGSIEVEGLGTSSVQGDLAFVDILEHMGCRVERSKTVVKVTGAPLHGIDVDMNAISDTVMTLGVVALFAEGLTRIRNVAHIRHKETDRIAALAIELRKLGATVDEQPDGLVIVPPAKILPAEIATYHDHRMAMAFALVGTQVEGVTILDPACVGKTYPDFWEDLAKIAPRS